MKPGWCGCDLVSPDDDVGWWLFRLYNTVITSIHHTGREGIFILLSFYFTDSAVFVFMYNIALLLKPHLFYCLSLAILFGLSFFVFHFPVSCFPFLPSNPARRSGKICQMAFQETPRQRSDASFVTTTLVLAYSLYSLRCYLASANYIFLRTCTDIESALNMNRILSGITFCACVLEVLLSYMLLRNN